MLSRKAAKLWSTVVLCLLLAWPSSAGAQEASAQEAGGPDHRGPFVRLSLGMAYSAAVSEDAARSQLRGGSGLAAFDLGLTLTRRLALHARIAGRAVLNPRVQQNDVNYGTLDKTSLSGILVGPGLTYYAPSNWYLSYVMGAARTKLRVGRKLEKSLIGYGFESDLGREWAAGSDLALGIGGRLSYYSVPQVGGHVKWIGFGLMLTATYH